MDPIRSINTAFYRNLESWTPTQRRAEDTHTDVGPHASTSDSATPDAPPSAKDISWPADPTDVFRSSSRLEAPGYDLRQMRERFGAKPPSREWLRQVQGGIQV